MRLQELNAYLASLADEIIEDAAHIVAETATSHFKQTFTEKAFDGNPWAPSRMPKRTGSLLIDKGALVNSIRPAYVSRERVVISAGNDHVPYAQVHNEGGDGGDYGADEAIFLGEVPRDQGREVAPFGSFAQADRNAEASVYGGLSGS